MDETALRSELTCPICLDIFTDPLILPCVHTFCKSCLQSVIEKNSLGAEFQQDLVFKSFKCPQCQRIIHVNERGIESVPKNHLVANIVALLDNGNQKEETKPNVNKQDKTQCSICEKSFPSSTTKMCLHCCGSFYCKMCLKQYHPSKGCYKRHVLLSAQDATWAKDKENFCNLHLLPCTVFCKSCDQPICPSCCVVGAHKTHDVNFYGKDGKPKETNMSDKIGPDPEVDPPANITLPTIARIASARSPRPPPEIPEHSDIQRPASSRMEATPDADRYFNQRLQELETELRLNTDLIEQRLMNGLREEEEEPTPSPLILSNEYLNPYPILRNIAPNSHIQRISPRRRVVDDSWLLSERRGTRQNTVPRRTGDTNRVVLQPSPQPTEMLTEDLQSTTPNLDDTLQRFMCRQRFTRNNRR